MGHQRRNWEWKFYKVKWLKPKLVFPQNLVANWVSSCLSLILSASVDATYIFIATCTTVIITLETCASNAEFSISYWDLIKFPYFVDTTERGDREWKQAQGNFTDNSIFNRMAINGVALSCQYLWVWSLVLPKKWWGSNQAYCYDCFLGHVTGTDTTGVLPVLLSEEGLQKLKACRSFHNCLAEVLSQTFVYISIIFCWEFVRTVESNG